MEVDSNALTLEEPLAFIRQQFMEPDGLLARIGQGEEINTNQVELVTKAFQMVQSVWQEKETVSREVVRVALLASSSTPRLELYIQSYPHRKNEIEQVLSMIREWIDVVFLPSAGSEEVALSLVSQHLLGTRSFSTELLQGRINEDSLGELLHGLKILAQAWQTRENISKLAAYAMLCAPWDFDQAAQHFSEGKLQRLSEIEQQVMESITRCLS